MQVDIFLKSRVHCTKPSLELKRWMQADRLYVFIVKYDHVLEAQKPDKCNFSSLFLAAKFYLRRLLDCMYVMQHF